MHRRSATAVLFLAAALACALGAPLAAHVTLDAPLGGQVLVAGTTFLIQWHVAVQHATVGWDLHYSTTGPNGPWIPIAVGLPVGDPTTGAMHSYLWTVPATASTQVRVRVTQDNSGLDYTSMSTSNLEIRMPLAAATAALSLAAGGTQAMTLEAGPAFAGQSYLLLGTASGTAPGVAAGSFLLPLNPDFYLDYTLAFPNVFPLSGSLGTFGPSGTAAATFTLPGGLAPPALAGITLHHAFVVVDATPAFSLASNAVALALQP